VIYEHGEPWWNGTGRGKLMNHLTELWQYYQQSHLVANQEELSEGNDEFFHTKYLCSYFKGIFNMP
jgi:hypothetical protein